MERGKQNTVRSTENQDKNIDRLRSAVSLVLPCLVLAACATVNSTNLYDPDAEHSKTGGLIYHLPKTLIELQIIPTYSAKTVGVDADKKLVPDFDKGAVRLDVEILKEKNVSDLSNSFVLSYEPDPLSTDRVCAVASKSGLLQSVETATDNKVPEIAVSLARLAGRLIGPSPFAQQGQLSQSGGKTIKVPERKLTMTIDPLNPDDLTILNNTLQDKFAGNNRADSSFAVRIPGVEHLQSRREAPVKCPKGSVCYRTTVSLPVIVENANRTNQSVDYADIANTNLNGFVKIERAMFVEKITKLGFDDGILTSMTIKKPSEVLEGVRLPLSVIDAVVTSALAAPSQAVGTTLGGLTGEEKTKLINELKTNTASIKAIQNDLREIRDDGVVEAAEANDAFKLKCEGVSGVKS